MAHKTGKLLYHLTALENLESIIQNGLLSRSDVQKLSFVDIADHEIIDKRDLKLNLNCYVPFHFYMGTAFDGRVFINSRKSGTNRKFIYLCVWRSTAKLNKWKIIPTHPLDESDIDIFDYDDGFEKIEWNVIDNPKRDYLDNHIREACMAECVSPSAVSINNIAYIKVPDDETKNMVESILKRYNINIDVDVIHFSRAYYG